MKTYFAGPDVFLQHAHDHFSRVCAHASSVGLDPIVPLDAEEGSVMESGDPLSLQIYLANIRKLEMAELIIANMNPFRGVEPDSGTVFEVGYAIAQAKPVILYGEDLSRAYVEKVSGTVNFYGHCLDENGLLIEDFGLPLNLMLAHSASFIVTGDVFDAIECAQTRFLKPAKNASRALQAR